MTSTSPTGGKLLAGAAEARGIGVLDAPVGGGIPAAEPGRCRCLSVETPIGGTLPGREPSGELRGTGKFRKDRRKRPA